MYDTVTDFLKTFSAGHSISWALLVVAVVASTSLILFAFWEMVLRIIFSGAPARKTAGRHSK